MANDWGAAPPAKTNAEYAEMAWGNRSSRTREFGAGATHVAADGSVHSAIRAAGGDPAKYIGVNKWDAESIRTVEDDRYRSQRED